MRYPAAFVIACVANAPALAAQPSPLFEVASVKPVAGWPPAPGSAGTRGRGGGCPLRFKIDRARVDIQCATLTDLIGYAFRFPPDRIAGPDWMMALLSPRFNIAATLPREASVKQIPEMVQALLADRFRLALHRSTREHVFYALVVAKGGLKVNAAVQKPDAAPDPDAADDHVMVVGEAQSRTTPTADGKGEATTLTNPRMGTVRGTEGSNRIQRWEAPGTTMAGLADLLDRVAPLPLPVMDMTGLEGRYSLVLEVSLSDLPSEHVQTELEPAVLKKFNDGLRKLGLQLERRKGPLENLVVDHVEKTPIEN
jgi:uncharacterized protein (TIGR03435 family)